MISCPNSFWDVHEWTSWSEPTIQKEKRYLRGKDNAYESVPADSLIQKRECKTCHYAQQRKVDAN